MQAELFSDSRCQLGEGPVFHQNHLYWIDIEGKNFHTLSIQSPNLHTISLPSRPGAAVPDDQGGWIFALETGIHRTASLENLALLPLAHHKEPEGTTRFNDGKVGPDGRFYVGTMGLDGRDKTGHFYRFSSDGSLQPLFDGVTCSNGLAWTRDRSTMFYIDTPTREAARFPFDPDSGALGTRETAFKIPEENGYPDGMTIDSEDRLWVAHWGGSNITCYDPQTGKALERIEVAAKNVTSCCFGGPERRDLYITTARIGTSEEDLTRFPNAGGVFVLKNIAVGYNPERFAI